MGSNDAATMQPLIQARNAALENPSLYPQVLPPILGLVTDSHGPSIDLRRWVADFLAETLASPSLASEEKQNMGLSILPVLKHFLETSGDDVVLLKSVIQAAASLYPLIFRHIINKPNDSSAWQIMATIKSTILRTMDSVAPGVRICCIKFVQRVVQTQTPGIIADPRRPELNEISLALVPRDHPLIPPANLEAETSGLLDRILGILQEDTRLARVIKRREKKTESDLDSDTLLLTATLNSLGVLIKSRATIATKIINTVLMFNPLKFGTPPITSKTKIIIRSLERTVRALLVNVLKRTPNHPTAGRMQAYIERLQQARVALFEEASRKRPAPAELAETPESSKRQRLDQAPDAAAAGPTSVAELFTITTDPGAQYFNVQSIPYETVAKLIVPLLRTVDKSRLDNAVNTVRKRYAALVQAQAQAQHQPSAAAPLQNAVIDDDEDYEPDYQPDEDAEQIRNRLEMESAADLGIGIPKPSQVSLGTFTLPAPRPLSREDLDRLSGSTMDNVLRRFDSFPQSTTNKLQKSGFNRLAASSNDRQAMITTYIRLITRPTAGLNMQSDANGVHTDEKLNIENMKQNAIVNMQVKGMHDRARQQILHYILNDWTRRMDIATTWLTEEWYNDKVCAEAFEREESGHQPSPNFPTWAHRFLDELSAFIGSEHTKLLVRFVSEVPGLDASIIEKVKRLALDPERVTMVVSAIHYLVLFRPPIRNICLDALEDLWRNYDGAKRPTTGVLKKFRPQVLETEVKQEVT